MAEATEFTIGARASCTDGPCGEVARVIISSAARTVTHLVIERKHERGAGRLVPVELVEIAGGEVRLRCSLAEFGQLDHAEQTEFMQEGGEAPLSGMPRPVGIPHSVRTVVQDAVPMGETEVGHGEGVYALDGEIGRVEGFVLDPGSHEVTHVLLQEGHLWGRKEVAIPVSAVTGVEYGIKLNLTKKQVEDLPPVD